MNGARRVGEFCYHAGDGELAKFGVGEADDHVAGQEVGVGEEVADAVDGGAWDVGGGGAEGVHDLGDRAVGDPAADQVVDLVAVLEAGDGAAEVRVVGQLGAADRGDEAAEDAVRGDGDHHPAVAGAVGVV